MRLTKNGFAQCFVSDSARRQVMNNLRTDMATDSAKTEADELRDLIRQQVFERAAKRWSQIHGRGVLGNWYGSRALKAILLVEFDDTDVTNTRCEGDAIGAWCRDHDGLRELDPDALDPGAVYGHVYWGSIWEKQIWRFHIAPDNRCAFIEEEDGPGRVWISNHDVLVQQGRVSLKCKKGRLLDKSPMTPWNITATICQWAVGILILAGCLALLAAIVGLAGLIVYRIDHGPTV